MQNWVPCLRRKFANQCTRSMELDEYLVESTAFWLILTPILFHLMVNTSNSLEPELGKGPNYVQRFGLSNAQVPSGCVSLLIIIFTC